jgi:hypothetical protein
VKTGLFGHNFVPELNIKNMENSPSFLSVTHTILSTKRFRRYGILKIYFAADFCFWAEQQLNGSNLLLCFRFGFARGQAKVQSWGMCWSSYNADSMRQHIE